MPSVSRSVGQTRLIRSFNFTASGSSTTNQIVAPIAAITGAWYFICITRASDSLDQLFQFSVAGLLTSDPDAQRYSIVGEAFDMTFKAKKTGSDLVFEVVNNDISDLNIVYIRIMK